MDLKEILIRILISLVLPICYGVIVLIEHILKKKKPKNKIETEKESKTPITYNPDPHNWNEDYTDYVAADFHWERGDID
ncbi:MAG: hypothetical protein ACFE95_09835 [Candidatus Hodarchaeota archaeon]